MSYHPTLREFVGQGKILRRALAFIAMYSLWSILLRGPSGCGKTVLAKALAIEGTKYCEAQTRILYYPTPHRQADTVPFEENMKYTVIVDECHLKTDYEWLYGAMEVNNYIFCSNMASELPEPFINRCRTYRLERYTEAELTKIIALHSRRYGVTLNDLVLGAIAQRSRGTPRTGIFLMQEYLALHKPRYNEATITEYFDMIGIDKLGLGRLDRKYLEALKSGHKSKNTLRVLLDVDMLELGRIEQYLIQRSMVVIESRGRRLA